MTSFTKALYRRDPAAAEAFHRQQRFEHRMLHGKTMLACFTPEAHDLPRYDGRVETGIGDYEDALAAARDPLGLSRWADRSYRRGGSK